MVLKPICADGTDGLAMIFDSADSAKDWLTQSSLDNLGNLLAYPTESVWGLGCDAFNQTAVERLLVLKNRPPDKGLIVLTSSALYVQRFLADLPAHRQAQIITSWDNPKGQATTWLFALPSNLPTPIPTWLTGGHDTLAIRVITHPAIKALCQSLICPANPYGFITSTSCNISGQPPASTLSQAQAQFGNHADVGFLTGDTLGFALPSQIKDARTGQIVRV